MSKLYPNLDPGKTEAILSLVGPASRRLQAQLFRHEDAYFALSPKVHPPDSLRGYFCTGRARLGSSSVLGSDRHGRHSRKHRRAVFSSPIVTHREKALLFQSLVWVYQEAKELDDLVGALSGLWPDKCCGRLMTVRPPCTLRPAKF